MELKGTIKLCLAIKEGIGKRSGQPWKMQTVVLTTDEQYAKDIAFTVSGDNCGKLSPGDRVTVEFDLSSREYKENWYTTVRGYKVTVDQPVAHQPDLPVGSNPEKPNDDLPF